MASRVFNYFRAKRPGRPRLQPRPVLTHDPALVGIQNADGSPFRPSLEQRRLMQLINETPGLFTATEMCARAGFSRISFYRWRRDPAFNAWFSRSFCTYFFQESWNLINMAHYNAAYKFSYFKFLADFAFSAQGQAVLDAWQQRMAHTVSAGDSFIGGLDDGVGVAGVDEEGPGNDGPNPGGGSCPGGQSGPSGGGNISKPGQRNQSVAVDSETNPTELVRAQLENAYAARPQPKNSFKLFQRMRRQLHHLPKIMLQPRLATA